jgi:ATP-dependent protease Clp ATPase subunit
MWRARTIRPDAVCTWCERPPSEVDKLIAGPKVYICDACVAAAEQAMAGRPNTRGFVARSRGAAARCAFCFKRAGKNQAFAASLPGHICADCLQVCRDILDGRAA